MDLSELSDNSDKKSDDDTTVTLEYNEDLREDFKEFGHAYVELQRGGIFTKQDPSKLKKLEKKLKSKNKTLSKEATNLKKTNDGSFGLKITDDNLISACILTNVERVSDDVKVMIEDFYDNFRGEFDSVYSEQAKQMMKVDKQMNRMEKQMNRMENKMTEIHIMQRDLGRMLCAVLYKLNKDKDKENVDPLQPKITTVLGKRKLDEEVRIEKV